MHERGGVPQLDKYQELPIFMGLETGGQPPSNVSEILH